MPINDRSAILSGARILLRCVCLALVGALIGGCATRPANVEMPFEAAARQAAESLLNQPVGLLGVVGRSSRRAVVLDPTLDAASGQQTFSTQRLDQLIGEVAARRADDVQLLPFKAANLAQADHLLTGTLTRVDTAYRIDVALVDLKNGRVVAQATALARRDGMNMNPLAYYRDSPLLVKDKVVEGYVRTSALAPGQNADAAYLDRIATATVINDATLLYNTARYREALGQYRSALATPAGDQIRVLTGIYLSLAKLGQSAQAEEAFGRLVAYGIANNNLSIKFLFNPGTTEFWSDPKVSSAYAMWLRQIARQTASTRSCVDILGHTSKTGAEVYNESLSLRRAVYIKQRLASEAPAVGSRAHAVGMGWRDNIVGSGTDDVVDALDRRVEFTMTDCVK